MRRATVRSGLVAVAAVLLVLSAFILWELGWVASGHRAFAEDFAREQVGHEGDSTPRASAISQRLDLFATHRLNRVAVVGPGVMACMAIVLIVFALRLPREGR